MGSAGPLLGVRVGSSADSVLQVEGEAMAMALPDHLTHQHLVFD
jgi:hypothetical protein